jgi:DNA-binding response OmpR family regulator
MDFPMFRAHVLVAIEDPGLRVQVEETMRVDGLSVTSVEDGLELLDALGSGDRWQLVIADVELGGFTGLEVLGMTDGDAERPPVVLVSSQIDLAMRRAARQFGATSIVGKGPFAIDEIRLIAGTILRPASIAPSLAAPRAITEPRRAA